MKIPVLLLFVFSFLVTCCGERPTQEEIAEYIGSEPFVFTESYILSKHLIQVHKDQEGKPSKAVIPVRGTIQASLDLSKVRSITVDASENTVYIALPFPVIRIELADTVKALNAIYCSDVSRSTFFEADVAGHYAEALPLFHQSVIESGISEQIQQDAAFALATMMRKPKFRNMDYKIEIIKYSEQDILDFIIQ